jgi:hypothetical protein
MKKVFYFTYMICWFANAKAQIFGGTPPSVKWQVIHTTPANIIFPPGTGQEAQQVAYLVSALSHTTVATIGSRQKPVEIVFHNLTTIPNGYVQLAPFRSEFQLTPSQNSFDLGSLPWNQMLAIHEYRHVQQYNNFCVGLSKALYFLFGQDGLAFANNVSVPDWFFEGDAVFQETLVSQQGRGRLPLFLTGFEALWVSRKNYSYMKIRNGSYRDFTPDHYPLGYMLVAYGRNQYGDDFWDKTAVSAAAFRGVFYPLQKAIKRNTGLSFDSFHTKAFDFFRDQLNDSAYTSFEAVYGKSKTHFVADQLFPQFTDNNQLVFVNSSYRLPSSFEFQKTGSEKLTRLKFRAVTLDDAFSYKKGKIAYTAYEPDLRWGWRDYSIIRILDLDSKKDIRLTNKSKYFSPDISPDGNSVVAVNMGITGKSFLDILNIRSGALLSQIANPDGLIYTYPKFLNSGTLVSAVRNTQGQMALMQIDIQSGKQQLLTNWSMNVLGFISVENNSIYFTRTYNGGDHGFCWRDGKVYQMKANAGGGNYQLSSYNGSLTWTGLTSAGYRLQTASTDNAFFSDPVIFPESDTSEKHKIYALGRPPFQIPSPIPDSNFSVKHYNSFTHPFNFYSWRPYVSDPDYTLGLEGENVLNSLQSELFVGYNRNEQYKTVGADFTYGGLFPFIDLGTEYLIDRNGYFGQQKIYWNELESYAGMYVPLSLSRGRWLTGVEAGSNVSYHNQFFSEPYKDSIGNTSYFSLDPQLFFSHQLQAAQMQINPSFAQTLTLLYNRAISNVSGNQFLASGNLYFPGLASTHSILISGSFQTRDSLNKVRFSNSFPFARGYSGENFFRMWGVGINYNLPVAYPDWGFANLIYFLRIRANAFYDFTGVPTFATNGPGVQSQYRSAGLEIYLDTKWWNELPLSFGIRYSRLLDPDYEGRGPNQWQLILPLNILDKGYSNHLARQ